MNLSSYELSQTERDLLAHGLKFIPTPEFLKTQNITCDTHNFALRATRQYYFNKKGKDYPHTPFKSTSEWEPPSEYIPKDILKTLENITKSTEDLDLDLTDHLNLPKEQYKSLTKLRMNTDIVIKKADKGSAIVILDKKDYIREAERQLGDPNYYQKLQEPIYDKTAATFTKILEELRDIPGEVGGRNQEGICGINDKQFEFLKPPGEIRERIFYLLPKIHKAPEKWSFPFKIPPGRPIVSDCSSEGYNIAAFIDYFLQPIACSHKAYIKDTNHFISLLRDLEVPESALLITADVDAMYTNIDHEQGLEAIKQALDENPPSPENPRIPDGYLLQLLEISLRQNDFQFNGDIYLQIKGTAMGKKFAPSYANIFMAQWEKDILQRSTLKPGTWNRFLDDVFLIWTQGRETLEQFFTFLNSDNPCIKLKQEVSDTQVDFLDTTVFKGKDIASTKRLSTRVYHKPTDTLELLHKESYHPHHTFPGIIKSQILRYHRLNTTKEDFEASCNKLFKALQPRGYTRRFLNKVKKQTLEDTNDPKPKGLKRHAHLLEAPDITYKASKCGSRRCSACPLLQEGTTFTDSRGTTIYPIQHNLDCKSTEVIYLITCTRCNLQYVGETSTSLQQRLWKYRNRIERQEFAPDLNLIEQHFRPENRHNGLADFSIMPIDHRVNPTGDTTYGTFLRQDREQFWINILNTKEPNGLNIKLRGEDNILPLVTTYSIPTQRWANDIAREWRQRTQPVHRRYLPSRILAAFRRNPNLCDWLCSSKLRIPIWEDVNNKLRHNAQQDLDDNNINILANLYSDANNGYSDEDTTEDPIILSQDDIDYILNLYELYKP